MSVCLSVTNRLILDPFRERERKREGGGVGGVLIYLLNALSSEASDHHTMTKSQLSARHSQHCAGYAATLTVVHV